jgi:hypothetical protein
VYDASGKKGAAQALKLPAVFLAPIRRDIVQSVHMNIAKNGRQVRFGFAAPPRLPAPQSGGLPRARARAERRHPPRPTAAIQPSASLLLALSRSLAPSTGLRRFQARRRADVCD